MLMDIFCRRRRHSEREPATMEFVAGAFSDG